MRFQKGHTPWNKGKPAPWVKNNPQTFKKGHTLWKGKKHSEASKRKISASLKGREVWNKGLKGLPTSWNKGVKGYKEGEKHYAWKGKNVGYGPLHSWVKRKLGRPSFCIQCGIRGKHYTRTTKEKVGKVWSIHWANKSGEYKRDLTDWIPLCVSCHRIYDGIRFFTVCHT